MIPFQQLINNGAFLYFSPDWRPENAIWIGASDTKQEGRFAWTDASPMDYKSKFENSFLIFDTHILVAKSY